MLNLETFTVDGKRGRFAYSDDILAAVTAHLQNLNIIGMTVHSQTFGTPSLDCNIEQSWAVEGRFTLSYSEELGRWELTFNWSSTRRTLAQAASAVSLYSGLITIGTNVLAMVEDFNCVVRE